MIAAGRYIIQLLFNFKQLLQIYNKGEVNLCTFYLATWFKFTWNYKYICHESIILKSK